MNEYRDAETTAPSERERSEDVVSEDVESRGERTPRDGVEIPPEIAAAWGRRPRTSKGPKPTLTVGRIVSAAVHTAVHEGLSAVSMNRVAGELGTAVMSLYRHVSGKDELLTLMVDDALGPPPANLPAPGDSWRTGLSRWAREIRQRELAHPWAVQVPISGPPVTPNQVRWMERGLRCLADTGLDGGEKISTILLVSGFVRTDTLLTVQLEQAGKRAESPTIMAGYSQLLRELTDPERFPALTGVLDEGVFDEEDDPDYDFSFGLDRILDGIEALVEQRRGRS